MDRIANGLAAGRAQFRAGRLAAAIATWKEALRVAYESENRAAAFALSKNLGDAALESGAELEAISYFDYALQLLAECNLQELHAFHPPLENVVKYIRRRRRRARRLLESPRLNVETTEVPGLVLSEEDEEGDEIESTPDGSSIAEDSSNADDTEIEVCTTCEMPGSDSNQIIVDEADGCPYCQSCFDEYYASLQPEIDTAVAKIDLDASVAQHTYDDGTLDAHVNASVTSQGFYEAETPENGEADLHSQAFLSAGFEGVAGSIRSHENGDIDYEEDKDTRGVADDEDAAQVDGMTALSHIDNDAVSEDRVKYKLESELDGACTSPTADGSGRRDEHNSAPKQEATTSPKEAAASVSTIKYSIEKLKSLCASTKAGIDEEMASGVYPDFSVVGTEATKKHGQPRTSLSDGATPAQTKITYSLESLRSFKQKKQETGHEEVASAIIPHEPSTSQNANIHDSSNKSLKVPSVEGEAKVSLHTASTPSTSTTKRKYSVDELKALAIPLSAKLIYSIAQLKALRRADQECPVEILRSEVSIVKDRQESTSVQNPSHRGSNHGVTKRSFNASKPTKTSPPPPPPQPSPTVATTNSLLPSLAACEAAQASLGPPPSPFDLACALFDTEAPNPGTVSFATQLKLFSSSA